MSKDLEALENVRTRQVVVPVENNIFGEYIIKGQELIAIEKDLKALEVIKELPEKYKEGLFYILLNALNERKISQEGYDFLKEVML